MPTPATIRINAQALLDFCARVFERLGVSPEDAHLAAEITVAADLRGITSHGVAHLERYVNGLRTGKIVARPQEKIVNQMPIIAVVDAGAGLGQPVAYRAMQMAIRQAVAHGAGFVAVRNSNHFGIAGYYAMMALEHDCIGFALTNATPKVVPTFGKNATLGTNPIAVAVPAGKARPFVLDMATSGVSIGKLEIADQWNQPIPAGWAIDHEGKPYTDPHRALEDFKHNLGGGLLPLGGEGERFGGHKGYGLALWVDIFAGILAGAGFATHVYPPFGDQAEHANVGHFFGAWRIDCFRPVNEFKETMDRWQQLLRDAPRADGQERIYIPGEKEFIQAERNRRDGIPQSAKVVAGLRQIADELQIEYKLD